MLQSQRLFRLLCPAFLACALGSCTLQAAQPSPQEIKQPCQSAHADATNLRSYLGEAKPSRLRLPVAATEDPHSGRTIIVIPSTEEQVTVSRLQRSRSGTWFKPNEQLPVVLQPGEIDLSLVHRLLYNDEQAQIVVIIEIPQQLLTRQGLEIQPVVDDLEGYKWRGIKPYTTQLSAQGFNSFFRPIARLDTGNEVPSELQKALDREIIPGSIYIPRSFQRHIEIIKEAVVDRDRCPIYPVEMETSNERQ
jgi:hypothetical protein